jgi:prevent-host-death family protein
MKLKDRVKPISYIKNHAAEILRDVTETRQSIIITQRGEAVAVLQDMEAYERTQETLALLKILAQSTQSLQQGKTRTSGKVFSDIRKSLRKG